MAMADNEEMYEMPRGGSPLTDGGNRQLVNGDEEDAIEASSQGLVARVVGAQENDSYVTGAFRRANVAGS